MKVLQLHSDFIEYTPIAKEIDQAEEAEPKPVRFEDLLVVFLSVEAQDDETVPPQAAEEILAFSQRLGVKRVLLYPYAHLSAELAPPEKALASFRSLYESLQGRGLEVHRSPFGWNKAFTIRVKGHPLAEQSRSYVPAGRAETVQIAEAVPEALKAEEKLRSRWFIIEPGGRSTPVEEFDFSGRERLKQLAEHEVAKSRAVGQVSPHVDLMRRLSLADYEPGSDPGNMRYYPKGRLVKSLIEQYVTRNVIDYGGMEVETPVMYDYHHPSLSKYLNRFPARQYMLKSEEKELFLRFAACFGQFLIAHDAQLSYRHLPFRLYELTRYSFRREKSGELVGLRRLRAFTMPDCHALVRDIDQAAEEAVTRMKLCQKTLKGIGLAEEEYELAIRFTEDFHREHGDLVDRLVSLHGRPALVEVWTDRFFYFIFKYEFNFVDNLGKASALSTDQIDVENGERYDINFVDADGTKKHPVIMHCSPSGAVERCIFALLEASFRRSSSGGVSGFPLWLSPTQIRIIPFSSEFLPDAQKIATDLERVQIRVDIDDREETVPKRIRDAEREWVPYILVAGEKERSSGILSVRDRVRREIRGMKIDELTSLIASETAGKPFMPLPPPRKLSARPIFTGGA